MTTSTVDNGSTPVRALLTGALRTVHPSLALRAAATVMAADGIGLLVVTNNEGGLAGVVSERDLVTSVGSGADIDSDRVDDIMAEDVVTIDADDPVSMAADRMVATDVRHLVVTDPDEGVIGVVSSRDVMRALVVMSASAEGGGQ